MRSPVAVGLTLLSLSACSMPRLDGTSTPTATPSPTAAPTADPPDPTSAGPGVVGHIPDDRRSPTPTAAAAAVSTLSAPSVAARGVPVGALPADLAATVPVASIAAAEAHDDAGDPTVTPGEIAVSWVLARHATRSDDSPGRRLAALRALSVDAALIATVDAATPRAAPETSGATWAVASAVSAVGDGWWRVAYTIKTTGPRPVGPTSTAASLDVHIGAGGLVIGERP